MPETRIENSNRKTITLSDKSGFFSLHAYEGDSLVFKMVGYKNQCFLVKSKNSGFTQFIRIFLIADTFTLSEVVIFSLPHDYIGFKEKFCNIKIENKEVKKIIIPGVVQYDGPVRTVKPLPFRNAATYLYQNYNKKARFEKKRNEAKAILKEQLKKYPPPVADSIK